MNTLDPARLYPRGFLVTKTSAPFVKELSNFRRVYSMSKLHVYVDELTEFDAAETSKSSCLIFGKAWPLSTGVLSEETQSVAAGLLDLLSRGGLGAVEEALYDLGGRYAVLIAKDEEVFVYNDACGTRSLFYDASRGSISSHFDILNRMAGDDLNREPYGAPLKLERMWELTTNPSVCALLPNFRLNLYMGTQTRFFGQKENVALSLTVEERLQTIERLWLEQLERIVGLDPDRPVAFSMTGGLDSRTSLAMVRGLVSRLKSFTYTTPGAIAGRAPDSKWAESLTLDHDLVMQMKEFLPADHYFIGREGANSWARDNAATLQRNSMRSHGRWILPGYLALFPDPRTVHLRGNLQEIGRLHMGRSNLVGQERFLRLIGASEIEDPTARARHESDMSERYRAHGYEDVESWYDIGDMWYWEHRHGRWYSQVLNETDTVFDTISPVNVRRILDCFLAFPDQDRVSALVQHKLILRHHPVLLFFGVNRRANLYESSAHAMNFA